MHRLAVGSAREAVRALAILVPGFEEYLSDNTSYAIFYGKTNIDESQLGYPPGDDDIRIAPIPHGSKNGGIFTLVLGIILIVVGVFTYQPSLIYAGIGLAIGGAMMMLSPQPASPDSGDSVTNRASYSFNGAVNTEAQGNPAPLLYGEAIVGSAVISGGIYVEGRA